jgi:hypothetical protein
MTCGAGHNQSSSYLPFVLSRSYIPCCNIKNPQPQTAAKTFLVPPSEAPLGMTFNTLNLTVFDKGLGDTAIRSDTLLQPGQKSTSQFILPRGHVMEPKDESNLHWPMTTLSPSFTRKAGETCADRLECRFSYLHRRQSSNIEWIQSFHTAQQHLEILHISPLILLNPSRMHCHMK